MSRAALRYRLNQQHVSHRLPFVGARYGRWSAWDVPLQGGQGGQIAPCIVGAAHHGCHTMDDLDITQLLDRANADLNSAKE